MNHLSVANGENQERRTKLALLSFSVGTQNNRVQLDTVTLPKEAPKQEEIIEQEEKVEWERARKEEEFIQEVLKWPWELLEPAFSDDARLNLWELINSIVINHSYLTKVTNPQLIAIIYIAISNYTGLWYGGWPPKKEVLSSLKEKCAANTLYNVLGNIHWRERAFCSR